MAKAQYGTNDLAEAAARKRRIVAALESGMAAVDVARQENVTPQYVHVVKNGYRDRGESYFREQTGWRGPPKRPREESRARKVRIVAALQAGKTPSEVARAENVTRQYVHLVQHGYEKHGEALFDMRAGRGKDRALTREHRAALRRIVTETRPADHGLEGPHWHEVHIKTWFRKEFGFTITRHQVRRVCTAFGLRLAPDPDFLARERARAEADGIPWTPPEFLGPPIPEPKKRGRGRPPAGAAKVEDEDDDDLEFLPTTADGQLDIEAMRAELERHRAAGALVGGPLLDAPAGPRPGKHSAGHRTPFTKPKKERRKKGKGRR